MVRMSTASIHGEERQLLYSVGVMFDVEEKFESAKKALDLLGGEADKETVEAVRWLAVRMANEAELFRREEGHSPQPLLDEKNIPLTQLQPLEYAELRDAVIKAITLGYAREVINEDEEIDLGLQELNEKK